MAGGLMKFADLIQKLLARQSAGKPKRPEAPARPTPDADVQPTEQILLSAAHADALRQARQDASNAERDVVQVSRAHLGTLVASPPRHRIAHLDDPELTPADRAELANSVRAALPAGTQKSR
jgi:hypothetical protein